MESNQNVVGDLEIFFRQVFPLRLIVARNIVYTVTHSKVSWQSQALAWCDMIKPSDYIK